MAQEMQLIEWKSNWRNEWLQWIAGYANAQGGVLEIGKNDKGDVVPLEGTKKLLEDIPNKIRNSLGIIADVDLKFQDEKPYIAISVQPYLFPISYHGKYYFRSGSTKQELTGRALDEFMMRKLGKTWDGAPIPRVGFEDLDPAAFDAFREKALKSDRLNEADLDITNEELLDSLSLVEGDYLTNAAVLLFHKKPDRLIPGAYVKLGYFETGADLLYQDEIHGPLVTLVDTVMEVLYLKYFKGIIHYEGIQRVDRYPVQQDAMRECILNALVHNAFDKYNPVQIKVFPDRVYVYNSGKLPDTWTVDTLFAPHNSTPRNPKLATAIFRTGMIEAWGRGIEKMVKGCKRIGAPDPVFREIGTDMSVEFIAPEDALLPTRENEPVNEPLNEPVNEPVLTFIKSNPHATYENISEATGFSRSKVMRQLQRMKQRGLIERIGSDKSGYWQVVD